MLENNGGVDKREIWCSFFPRELATPVRVLFPFDFRLESGEGIQVW